MSVYVCGLQLSVLSWNSLESDPKTRISMQITDLRGGQGRQAREGTQYRVRERAASCCASQTHLTLLATSGSLQRASLSGI